MSFREVTIDIGARFQKAREETYEDHPLAMKIRNDWPDAARSMLSAEFPHCKFDSSAGAGQWNFAPWLAVLHRDVTTSAQAGFYPVYLFEPEFKTVCLVMGQGAQRLQSAMGKRRSLLELADRAERLRIATHEWETLGFTAGPFKTTRDASVKKLSAGGDDPWSVSVAFGKRYLLDAMPEDEILATDLRSMLDLYQRLVKMREFRFAALDEDLAKLKEDGELPKGEIDGAKKVVYHKRIESRARNAGLIRKAKKHLGYICQACSFSFADMYGGHMHRFIEAHHAVPLSDAPDEGIELTPTSDHFIVLCSNCHRAIHAAGCPELEVFRGQLRRSLQLGDPGASTSSQ